MVTDGENDPAVAEFHFELPWPRGGTPVRFRNQLYN